MFTVPDIASLEEGAVGRAVLQRSATLLGREAYLYANISHPKACAGTNFIISPPKIHLNNAGINK